MHIEKKLAILADAAKYDVSCASSGSRRKTSGRTLGKPAASGICHSYTEDGRCVSLLKILFTNACIYDCAYCVNRSSSDIPRAAFSPAEIVSLTIDFYRRNYIEGLFLSSGVMRSPDDTMERLVATVRKLRREGFGGYIHLKCVPYASRRLVSLAGLHADRLSINIELPSDDSLHKLTGAKTHASVMEPMGVIRDRIVQAREERKTLRHSPVFAPAGQSTQLIIGASPESDHQILNLADRMYRHQALKRVYYSAYIPVDTPNPQLPQIVTPPLLRENRLYQADWLIRLYGFHIDEVINKASPFLDLEIDPKQAFAQRNPALFPVDVNDADLETILKVPGIGLTSARRIVSLRRAGRIRWEHLKQMGVVVSRAGAYVHCDGRSYAQWQGADLDGNIGNEMPVVGASEIPKSRKSGSVKKDEHLVYSTDGSFEGLLTAIFESYGRKQAPSAVETARNGQLGLFDRRIPVQTDPSKSERVWKGIKTHLGSGQRRMLFDAFLSNAPGVATTIYCWVRSALPARDKSDIAAQITIEKLSRQVRREAHRMKGFVRFRKTRQNCYVALISPRYDVLPLVRSHFESRYPNQKWLIYDRRRDYGLYYDLKRTRELKLDRPDLIEAGREDAAGERLCQILWQSYYQAATIDSRHNTKLHLRQLPRRYWRYLPEKQP